MNPLKFEQVRLSLKKERKSHEHFIVSRLAQSCVVVCRPVVQFMLAHSALQIKYRSLDNNIVTD